MARLICTTIKLHSKCNNCKDLSTTIQIKWHDTEKSLSVGIAVNRNNRCDYFQALKSKGQLDKKNG